MELEQAPKQKTLAIYARVSTDEQKEGQTIDSQISELERFARERVWVVAGVYKDEGWSGAVMARPELDRLRDDAAKGLFDAVLLNDVDRLARDVTHLGVIKRDLERHGVQVIFRKLPAEASPTQNLMVNILGSFAEFERELISDRTRRGRRHKVEVRKQFLGSLAPYGFRYIPKDRARGTDGRLELHPEEVIVVRQMFTWVADEGLSARRVLARLNELRVPPRKGSRTWAKSTILRILHSEVYAGLWHYNKHQGVEPTQAPGPVRYRRHLKTVLRRRPRAEWIPLQLTEQLHVVSRQQWQRVQDQLSQNIAFSPRHGKHFYLLKGLVRCGGCLAQYVGEPCHGRYFYRCNKRCKRVRMVQEKVIDEAVWQAVEAVMLKPDVIADGIARQQAGQRAKLATAASERRQLDAALAQIDTEGVRVLEVYRLGIISPDQLRQELGKINNRRSALRARTPKMGNEIQPPVAELRKSLHDYCRQAAASMAGFNDQERQRFLRLLHLECVFTGNIVRIKGRLPTGASGATPERLADPKLSPASRIAGTGIDRHARNPTGEIGFETNAAVQKAG